MKHRHPDELGTLVEHALANGRVPRVVHAGATMAETLRRFGEQLGFPDYYGRNLDALVDCLRDLADEQRRAITLIVAAVGPLRERDPDGYATLVELLDETESERDDLAVVVLDSSGDPEGSTR